MHDQLTEGRQERVHDRAVRRTAEVPESLRPAWIAHDSSSGPAPLSQNSTKPSTANSCA